MKEERIIGLDLLRSYAILSVMIGHSFFIFDGKENKTIVHFINLFLLDGVGIFFVLSGFLIGGILIQTLQKDGLKLATIIHFWIRRWLRTLPAYYLILFLLFVAYYLQHRITLLQFIPYVFFRQNFIHPPSTRFFGESWSLAIEEWFYLFLPIYFFIFLKTTKEKFSTLIICCCTVLLFGILYRYLISCKNEIEHPFLHQTVLFRIDNLMYGVLLSYFNYFYKELLNKNARLLFYLSIFLLLLLTFILPSLFAYLHHNSLYHNNISYPLLSISVALIIPYLLTVKLSNATLIKTILIISKISYSLYLIHLGLVQKILWNAFNLILHLQNGTRTYITIHYIFYWTVSFLLAYIMYLFVEQPFMQLRKYFTISEIEAKLNKNIG